VAEFRARFHDTGLFDPGAGARFAAFLLRAHEAHGDPAQAPSHERAHQQIEEAQLFIEAAHACYDRLQGGAPAAVPVRAGAGAEPAAERQTA
jgi:sulfite reductase (ferredoxin)